MELKDFQELCNQAWDQREVVARLKKELKQASDVLEGTKAKLLACMEVHDIEKHEVPGRGLLYIQWRTSVKVPRDFDTKKRFFAFLRERGVYDEMVSVNSQTLNAWYRDALQEAVVLGEDEFNPPGLEEPSIQKILAFKK